MGIIGEAFNPRPRGEQWSPSASPTNDGWYVRDISGFVAEAAGGSGLVLTPETILNCWTVLAAVRFRGNSWAVCPPSTYKKTKDGRVAMPDHYSERVLRNPNAFQTGFRWRQMNGVRQALWGNSPNEIFATADSFAGELRPLHPGYTRIVDQRNDGTLIYLSNPPGQPEKRLGQEKVLHFRDLTVDGLNGLEIYRLIRNVVGIALLAERHTTTFLRKGTRISGLLVPTAPLGDPERKALRESVNADFGGTNVTGMLGVLPHGVDLKQLTGTTKDSQLLELNDQVVGMILGFLGTPGVVVGWSKDLMGYASADAFFEKGGIRQCVLPTLVNAEAEMEMALLLNDEGLQIKHNLDVLNRSNTKDRYDANFKAVGGPWMTRNEIRKQEDLNPDSDPEMDKILTPSNMAPELQKDLAYPSGPTTDEPPAKKPTQAPPADDSQDEQAARLAAKADRMEGRQAARLARAESLARIEAGRIVRREQAFVKDKAPKYASNPEGWKGWLAGAYARHADHVAESLEIAPAAAKRYADAQCAAVLAGGMKVVEEMEERATEQLVALALEV